MSRGNGKWQRRLLDLLAGDIRAMPLRGNTRAKSVAIRRAAYALAAKGQVDIVHFLDQRNNLVAYATLPGATGTTGKSLRELSVAAVPSCLSGTAATLKKSFRGLAKELGFSKSTWCRWLQEAGLPAGLPGHIPLS